MCEVARGGGPGGHEDGGEEIDEMDELVEGGIVPESVRARGGEDWDERRQARDGQRWSCAHFCRFGRMWRSVSTVADGPMISQSLTR